MIYPYATDGVDGLIMEANRAVLPKLLKVFCVLTA
jgi:hypothetical protein